eukprot:COSAG05_NODE_68_length_22188_cov_8.265019_6_plen_876_part_00
MAQPHQRFDHLVRLAEELPHILSKLTRVQEELLGVYNPTPDEADAASASAAALLAELLAEHGVLAPLFRSCAGIRADGEPTDATESEWSRASDVADSAQPVRIDGKDIDPPFKKLAESVGQKLGIKNTETCAYLLSDLNTWHRGRMVDVSTWAEAEWESNAVTTFFDLRKNLLRVLKELLKLASEDEQLRTVLRDDNKLFSRERRSYDGLVEPLLGYFGFEGSEYRRNKQLRERAGPNLLAVLHEHRLVAQCLFYLARGSDGEWGVEHLRSLYAIIKDLVQNGNTALSSGDGVLEFPKNWTVDEQRSARQADDENKKYAAELAHITSVLCLTWWEAVHRTRSRGKGSSRDQDEEKLKELVGLVQQEELLATHQGFGHVMDLFVRVGIHQFVNHRTQNEGGRYVRSPWEPGGQVDQLRTWHKGAFEYLGDVLTCLRVKAEPDDAVSVLRSLQGFMLHLVEKYIRPVILLPGQDAEGQQEDPEPEQVRKLEYLLRFWAELCKCIRNSVQPHEQKWLDAKRTTQALYSIELKHFLHWGIESFTKDDMRIAEDKRHIVTVSCFEHFCTVMGFYCCFEDEVEVATELLTHLLDRGWWNSQARGQESNRSIGPVLETFERLLSQRVTREQGGNHGLAAKQRTFSIGSLRLLQDIVAVVGRPTQLLPATAVMSDGSSTLSRWMKALIGMISLETGKPPALRVELFKTVSSLVDVSKDLEVRELLLLLDKIKLLDEVGMPAELHQFEAQTQVCMRPLHSPPKPKFESKYGCGCVQTFPVVRAYLELMQALLSQRPYWELSLAPDRPLQTKEGHSPLRLLVFVQRDVLEKHFAGRQYADSGEKWQMALSAFSVMLELVQPTPTGPAWMLDEIKLVLRIFDTPGE